MASDMVLVDMEEGERASCTGDDCCIKASMIPRSKTQASFG